LLEEIVFELQVSFALPDAGKLANNLLIAARN